MSPHKLPRSARATPQSIGPVGVLSRGRGKRELWTDNLELHRKWRSYSGPEPTLLRSAAHAAMESLYGIRPLLRRAKSDSGTERSPLGTQVA